jgi:hypothetical protein
MVDRAMREEIRSTARDEGGSCVDRGSWIMKARQLQDADILHPVDR